MCFIKVTTDGAENCQEIFRILLYKEFVILSIAKNL
jgi:hypothetical protein